MKLSLSVRVAEKFQAKREANMTLEELATLAAHYGYQALCMRASQVGTHSSATVVATANTLLAQHHLAISMVTGDFPILPPILYGLSPPSQKSLESGCRFLPLLGLKVGESLVRNVKPSPPTLA